MQAISCGGQQKIGTLFQSQRQRGRRDCLRHRVLSGDHIREHRPGTGGPHLQIRHECQAAELPCGPEPDQFHLLAINPRQDRPAPDSSTGVVGMPFEKTGDLGQLGPVEFPAGKAIP